MSSHTPSRRPQASLTIDIVGISVHRTLEARVRRQFVKMLRAVRGSPCLARAAFFDENGPKGGLDTRCTLTLKIPRHRPLRAEQIAGSARLAFDAAFEALDRSIAESLARRRTLRRRPKKYFVAGRLLAGAEP